MNRDEPTTRHPCTCFHTSIHGPGGCGKTDRSGNRCPCKFDGDPGNPFGGINCVIVRPPLMESKEAK